jgi:hypothetical protein
VEALELPKPLYEVIVGFLGGKDMEILVTSEEKYEKYLLSLD